MELSEEMKVAELNPIENVNVIWCYIVISIFYYLPKFLEENIIGYTLLLVVYFFLLKEYLKNRKIECKYLLRGASINFMETIWIFILIIGVQILFRYASVYIFSYISPSRLIKYLSEQVPHVLTISTFINAVIIGPILEELFFRGILLNRLKRFSVNKRLIISSIIFGMVHLEWALVIAIIGYFLGYVYLKTRSLVTPIILHSAINLFVFLVMYYESGEKMIYSIGQIRSECFYSFLAFLIVLPIYIFLFKRSWINIKSFDEVPYIKNMMKEELQ